MAAKKSQAKLFSFFTKASAPSTPSTPAAPASDGGKESETQAASSTPKADEQELVGKTIRVFWRNDKKWYTASVCAYDSSSARHHLKYEDGEEEHLSLANEQYQVVDADQPSAKKAKIAARAESVAITPNAKTTPKPTKRRAAAATNTRKRTIVDDEDDDGLHSSDSGGDNDDDDDYKDDASVVSSSSSEAEWADSDDEDDNTAANEDEEEEGDTKKRRRLVKGKSTAGKANKRANKQADTPGSVQRTPAPSMIRQPNATPVSSIAASKSVPTPSKLFTPSSGKKGASKPTMSPMTPMNLNEGNGVVGFGRHEHHSWSFLNEDRRDDKLRRADHPHFNHRTLHVPPDFLKKQTPAMQQWWEFKSKNMDTVLFFKVGKFYELFHMDSDVGVRELDLIYMKGEKAHCGFPEIGYGKFASILVAKGYRVARVEQTETPDMLKEANKNSMGKKRNVVLRELCSVVSRGTRTFCHLDDLTALEEAPQASSSSVFICVTEQQHTEVETADGSSAAEYGICLVDCQLATVTLAQFCDDDQRNRLRTLLSRHPPAEVLLERDGFSDLTRGIIRLVSPANTHIEVLRPDEEVFSADKTVALLREGKYFLADGKTAEEESNKTSGTSRWPQLLQAVLQGLPTSELMVRALGGALWHLRRSLIDYEILSMGRFYAYAPPDDNTPAFGAEVAPVAAADEQKEEVHDSDACLVLDGITMANLELLRNTYDGSERGSLWSFINRCRTVMGKRLLKHWLCRPLMDVNAIHARQDAIEELSSALSVEADLVRGLLKKLPDIERLLSRIHSLGSQRRNSEHPDSRAVMYETDKYNTRKVRDFVTVLDGLQTIQDLPNLFSSAAIQSPLLRKIVTFAPAGRFPNITEQLAFFRQAFDAKKALADGVLKPRAGVDEDYDRAGDSIAETQSELEAHLKEQKAKLGCSDLKYFGKQNDRFQIEVPERCFDKVPRDWEVKSQRKGFRRFWTPRVKDLLQDLTRSEAALEVAQRDQMRKVFEKFDRERAVWSGAVAAVSTLDALLSLAEVSALPGYVRPIVETVGEAGPVLHLEGSRHPTLEHTLGGEFIPNDVQLGGLTRHDGNEMDQFTPRLMLLSGPNMGGKSTILRQTCLIAIMAQLGCFVPANVCRMTPVDRIFTRIGASDKILAGQSTFFVELAETAMILHHATNQSLVILDELGRGTSTFDGTAIAHAVAEHLVSVSRCRTMFATHYHSLVEEWSFDPRVRLGHMQCLVDTNQPEDEVAEQKVTFLYKLGEGASPKSYGVNVAKLARLPPQVLRLAVEKSAEFEAAFKDRTHSLKRKRVSLGLSGEVPDGENAAVLVAGFDTESCYERLRSILGTDMSDSEFVATVTQLWKRFNAARELLQQQSDSIL